MVQAAVETVRPLIDQRKHELTVSLPPEPIWVYADASRLEQVVVNLLTNAAKYTDEGGHVWLTVQEEVGACVLRVRDTGVGISAELLPHIFDLFMQAERLMDRSQGGLGIGLSLVRRLVELHGGTVEASSEPGKGSEFVVRLPAGPMPALQLSPPATESFQSATGKLRVLVVDDNADMAEGMALLLKEEGHDVRTIHDGPTALQAAVDYRPHAVLLDIGLPGLNGYEVAKWIRKQSILRGVVLVALTGYGQEADRQTSIKAGFNYHVVKPIDFNRVKTILAAIPVDRDGRGEIPS
jgi:CheY-like chemotaxis protein